MDKQKENAIAFFTQQAKGVMAQNAPMLPAGVKITVGDADKYTALKNGIQDKMLAIPTPLLTEKEKWDVIMSIEDELDMFIRKTAM
jgi:hypothetical protein